MHKTIEIHGVGMHNRGAELMAQSIAYELRTRLEAVKICVGGSYGDFASRAAHQFYLVDSVPGRLAGPFIRYAPPSARRLLGIVREREVNAVLDASGFAFSDQMGPEAAERLVRKMAARNRLEQPLILMPQAFGPFQRSEVAHASRKLLQRAKLIYARDPESCRYVNDLMGAQIAHVAPDFTVGLQPVPDRSVALPDDFVAIVPNNRMLTSSSDKNGERYLGLLSDACEVIYDFGSKVVIVKHAANEDDHVVSRLLEKTRVDCVVTHKEARVLKWILGRARFVIGSRYHALISAMSLGVPSVGLGWSHKYKFLFEDFRHDGGLFRVDDQAREFMDEVTRCAGGKELSGLSAALNDAKACLLRKCDAMWGDVLSILKEADV